MPLRNVYIFFSYGLFSFDSFFDKKGKFYVRIPPMSELVSRGRWRRSVMFVVFTWFRSVYGCHSGVTVVVSCGEVLMHTTGQVSFIGRILIVVQRQDGFSVTIRWYASSYPKFTAYKIATLSFPKRESSLTRCCQWEMTWLKFVRNLIRLFTAM